jgi:CspA family cold shock protein
MTEQRNVGMVKWFNNKTGYGFITVLSGDQHKGKDIFVHYKSIRAEQEDANYKYLVQGEYVQFDIVRPANENHEYHAVDITGIEGGPTMCETRRVASLAQRERGPVVDDREFVRVPSRRPNRKPQATR